jgi:hypothetical protein
MPLRSRQVCLYGATLKRKHDSLPNGFTRATQVERLLEVLRKAIGGYIQPESASEFWFLCPEDFICRRFTYFKHGHFSCRIPGP